MSGSCSPVLTLVSARRWPSLLRVLLTPFDNHGKP